jgi:adenylate cyclase
MRRVGVAAAIALVAFLLAVGLDALGAVERLELITLDARYRSGLGRKAAGDDIVVAWIDQESMDYMDKNGVPFPWPREVYGQVLEYLRKCGAKVVAFDILFDQRSQADDERAFAAALAAGPGDVLAMKFVDFRDGGRDQAETDAFAARVPTTLPQVPAESPRERGFVLPLPEFVAGADWLGFVNIRADADGTFRHYDLLRPWGPAGDEARLRASFAAATLFAAGRDLTNEVVTAARDMRMLLNLRGPAFTFKPLKFVNILESINRADAGQPPLYPPETFRDKFVLIGIHAEGYEDAHPTPLDAHLPGVELHATALDNLLRSDPLHAPAIDHVLAGIAAAAATAIVFTLPGVVWPLLGLAVLMGLALGWVALSWLNLVALPMAAPLLAGGSAAAGAFGWRLVVEGKQKREMHRAFRSYLAPEVLAEVLRDPAALRLGGEVRDVTLFFTDLQGFTSLAERSAPQQLVGFLNDYFTRMCVPVLAQRGIIDKFIGDAIMAIFGAPATTPDHGRAAVHAALQALAISDTIAAELRTRGLPAIQTRIGIHRGDAVVGNMGSASRFDYTAIGDSVNLAARLEGANKAFGTRCLCSETAWADATATVLGREVGRVTVVGRAQPIRVFEPLVLRAAATADDLAWAQRWQSAVAAVERHDRAAAAPHFAACAAARPDDPLLATWRRQLDDPAFAGVFVLDHK